MESKITVLNLTGRPQMVLVHSEQETPDTERIHRDVVQLLSETPNLKGVPVAVVAPRVDLRFVGMKPEKPTPTIEDAFSKRVVNVLLKLKPQPADLWDVSRFSADEIFCVMGAGEATLQAVVTALRAHGLELQGWHPMPPAVTWPIVPRPGDHALPSN